MRTAKVERDLASQAGLWYTKLRNNVVPSGAMNTLGRINPTRRSIMTTVSPHADNGNLIPATSGIYKITCTANKKIYIGSALNLYLRRHVHFSELRYNKHVNRHLQNAWNKYGEQSFTFEVLEYVLPISLATREQYWFKKLKPFGHKGFNIAIEAGSPLGNKSRIGMKNIPESTEASRQARTGMKRSPEFRERMRQSKMGKKMSPEAIKNIADGHRGTKRSPETREKMRQSGLAAWQRRRSNKHGQTS